MEPCAHNGVDGLHVFGHESADVVWRQGLDQGKMMDGRKPLLGVSSRIDAVPQGFD
jgi:hypothetical protein